MSTDLYDPAQVHVTFLGSRIVGFAKGTFISVEREGDGFTKMVGSDGYTARARNNDRSGRITITLMSTSPSNDVLSAAAKADELAGTGIGAFMVKDNFGRTRLAAANAWVAKFPSVEFADEVSQREWVLDADYIDFTVGGAATV